TIGPPNVENGVYRNVFFATTNAGRMYAFANNGTLAKVFDTNGDGVADNYVLTIGNFVGLAFAPVDYNLWHPTMRRDSFPGHGINPAFDDSRDVNSNQQAVVAPFPSWSKDESNGGASFYFGLEQWNNTAITTSGSASLNGNYLRYASGSEQYGELGGLGYRHQEQLTRFNTTIGNNYNVPGGAHGALQTNSFSLDGYERTDKPTLYVNYFLETEGGSGTTGNRAMVDSARIFVSRDDGASWEQVATNNSARTSITTPTSPNTELPTYYSASRDAYSAAPNQAVQELFDNTGSWRQTRIDLADFAGEPNLKLRFDFSTAGVMTFDRSHPGDFVGDGFVDGQGSIPGSRGQNNSFEGFYIDDIIIGFAERGEMVTGPTDNVNDNNSTPVPQNPVFGAPVESLVGPYQVEVRRGTEYTGNDVTKFDWNDPGNPFAPGQPLSPIDGITGADETKILTTFDTNERFVRSFTIDAPTALAVNDTELIRISDGVNFTIFEFDNNNSITSGNRAILFTGNETADQMAIKIRDAVNGVATLNVTADTQLTDHRVELVGAATVDFLTTPQRLTLSVLGGIQTIAENDASPGQVQATVTRTGPIDRALTVTLTSSDVLLGAGFNNGTFQPTINITIPAGDRTSAPFTIEATSDTFADRLITTFITAAANGFDSITLPIDVTDDELATLSVTLVNGAASPTIPDISEIAGHGTVTATISRNTVTANTPQYFEVEALDASELRVTNDSAFAAQNVDVEDWTTTVNPSIHNFVNAYGFTTQWGGATINQPLRPNTTINVLHDNTAVIRDNSLDFFSFYVDPANCGATAVCGASFDIDNSTTDLALFLWAFDESVNNFVLLASNDDTLVSGRPTVLPEINTAESNTNDPFLEATFDKRGFYVIEVARGGSAGSALPPGSGHTVVPAGAGYQLHVAVDGHSTSSTLETGGSVVRALMPAGANTATVGFSPQQDNIAEGDITTNFAVSAPFFAHGIGTVNVRDSGVVFIPSLTINSAGFVSEGGAALTATVSIDQPNNFDLVVSLVSADTSELRVPAQVTIPRFSTTSASFTITPVEDAHQDGNQLANVLAMAGG
ncbi:MAG: hypothetical protein HYV60_13635, partial [Planctomycetia bacterium]|nr:hypothetical protein [Planctomycetia bacterium]